jgi:hypothetical protein
MGANCNCSTIWGLRRESAPAVPTGDRLAARKHFQSRQAGEHGFNYSAKGGWLGTVSPAIRDDNGVILFALCRRGNVAVRTYQQHFVLVACPKTGATVIFDPHKMQLIKKAPSSHDISACGSIGTVAHRNNTQSLAAGTPSAMMAPRLGPIEPKLRTMGHLPSFVDRDKYRNAGRHLHTASGGCAPGSASSALRQLR